MMAGSKLAQRVRADRRLNDDWGSFASRAIASPGGLRQREALSARRERARLERIFTPTRI